MQSVRENISLEELSERISKIFSIEQIKHTRHENKITVIKFNIDQKNENFNHTIIELLNLYIVPAFVLPSDQKNKDVSVRIGNRQETFIVKRYIKQDNTYIESTQLEQQKSSGGLLKKAKNIAQSLISGKEEIEFIEINKSNLNFQISSDKSTEVEITFAESEINIEHIKSILSCASNFLKLKNHDSIKPPIEIGYNWSGAESQDELNIYPFFAKRTIRDNKGNIKQQETVLCLTTRQNDVELASSISRGNTNQLKIKYKENEYSLLIFSQSLIDLLLFFNDPPRNREAQISNLQRIEKIFSEDIEIKSDKEENSSNKAKIRIENATCFTSSLHYEDKNLQLKKSSSGEKIYFNFEVRIENDLDQIGSESKFIYDSTIYKIASLISFFALSFNENEFSISAETNNPKEVDTKNIFSIQTNPHHLELVSAICKELKKDFTNFKQPHVQVLDLFCTQGVSFKLEAEAQKIAINRLKDIKDLISGISKLDLCKKDFLSNKEFLDSTNNPLVHCYLSNFFYEGNNLSCKYVTIHPKNLSINGGLLDKNSAIDFLQNKLQKNFDRISNNLKQIQKEENFSVYSIDINVDKLLSHNKPQEEEATEVTEETEITAEEVKAEPQKYDVDWEEGCFAKIISANDYTSLELSLKEACEFVYYRILHVCKQLLEKINTLQLGKEQKVEQDNQLSIDESIIQATLDNNIHNLSSFINKKKEELNSIKQKSNFNTSQANTTENKIQEYIDFLEGKKTLDTTKVYLISIEKDKILNEINNYIDKEKRKKEPGTIEKNINFTRENDILNDIQNYINPTNSKRRSFDEVKQYINSINCEREWTRVNKIQRYISSEINVEFNAVQNYQKIVKIYLFINKNTNYLQKILEKNVEELERLMLDVQMNKNDHIIDEIAKPLAEQDLSAKGLTQPDRTTQQEKSQGQELSNTENDNPSPTNSDEQTDCIEEEVENDTKQESKITSDYIFTLFNKLNKRLAKWANLDQSSQNQVASNDQEKSIPDLFRNLTSKIIRSIKLKEEGANVEQTQTSEQYKQILNLVENIFYSAKILHYYKTKDGFKKLETEIKEIEGVTRSYLLDKEEEELKRREAQLKQKIRMRETGSDITVNIAQIAVSLCKKVKDKITNLKGQPQNSNVQNVEYLNNSFCSQDNDSTYNYSNQQSYYRENNTKVVSQPNYFIADSAYRKKHKLSNLQKLKTGIKDAFSEKENYAFLMFIIVGTAGVLAYFVPEGLRKFVPSKKLNIIDITVAVGVTALIALSVVALAYSVYTNIVHSNMTDPTISSRNQSITNKS